MHVQLSAVIQQQKIYFLFVIKTQSELLVTMKSLRITIKQNLFFYIIFLKKC